MTASSQCVPCSHIHRSATRGAVEGSPSPTMLGVTRLHYFLFLEQHLFFWTKSTVTTQCTLMSTPSRPRLLAEKETLELSMAQRHDECIVPFASALNRPVAKGDHCCLKCSPLRQIYDRSPSSTVLNTSSYCPKRRVISWRYGAKRTRDCICTRQTAMYVSLHAQQHAYLPDGLHKIAHGDCSRHFGIPEPSGSSNTWRWKGVGQQKERRGIRRRAGRGGRTKRGREPALVL